jgi:hypothetical protein
MGKAIFRNSEKHLRRDSEAFAQSLAAAFTDSAVAVEDFADVAA